MQTKVTRIKYYKFSREGNGSYTPELHVPAPLMKNVGSPRMYAGNMGSIVVCDFDGSNLIPNEERTLEERARIIELSPRVMGIAEGEANIRALMIRDEDRLAFTPWDNKIIEPVNGGDYVCQSLAAAKYLGIPLKIFNKLKAKEEIGTYKINTRLQTGRGRTNVQGQLQLFLLAELNLYK
ncbi:MAG: hypothetical protein ABIJ18_01815 [archaeon]